MPSSKTPRTPGPNGVFLQGDRRGRACKLTTRSGRRGAHPAAFWRSGPRNWGTPQGPRFSRTPTRRFYKWCRGRTHNIVLNALDRHQTTHVRNKVAIIWEGEDGTVKVYSYFELNREVCRFASVLKSMGVRKGDRVTIYLPRVPELPIAMLACAKIGAVHSVVYGGFSVEALHGRIEDSERVSSHR